jgi:glycosyltransferase involved in cell wall biosynthesis
MTKKKVFVSVSNDLSTDQRVHKICTFIESQGYDVELIGRKLKNSLPLERTYKTKRFKLLFNKGALFYANLNCYLFFYLLFKKADILVANDLDTLLPNFLVSKFRKTKLVYDSHEYFTGVPELQNKKLIKFIWETIEKWIFPKLTFIMTVNSSIQEIYEEKYKVPILVVRNVAPKWVEKKIKSKKELGIPENKFLLIFQGAGINIHRGAEEITLAMKDLYDCCLLFVGDGDVINKIKKIVKTNDIVNVIFFPKMPYQEMLNYTYHADLGLSLDKTSNENYLNSLPNKVFDYIQTETPILASSVPQVKTIIEKHNIGVCIDEITPQNLVNTMKMILNNKNLYEHWKQNCKLAKETENWENEVEKLSDFYPVY